MKNYTIEHATTSIICTKKFYENASQFGTPECDECQKLRKAFPDYSISVRAIKANENKRTANKNLTYPVMVRYMVTQPGGMEKLVEFAKIRNLSEQKGRSYAAVKDWFLNNYPAFMLGGVSEQEMENAERFISLATAREILEQFSKCETLVEVQDIIATHFEKTDVGKVYKMAG